MKFLRYILLILVAFNPLLATRPRVTFSMIMKNEAGRMLRECLCEIREYAKVVDLNVVIIDDASTDASVAIVHEVFDGTGIPLILIQNPESKFHNEINLRKQQWDETIKTNPEWILNIDADQIFEKRMRQEIFNLTNQHEVDVWCFRLYDFWDEDHYRDDAMWCAHKTYRCFLLRYHPEFHYEWQETPQHCGHFPKNLYVFRSAKSALRLKHYGWANKEDRIAKYHRYMKLDPGAKYGWMAQYESILDEDPHLTKWIE